MRKDAALSDTGHAVEPVAIADFCFYATYNIFSISGIWMLSNALVKSMKLIAMGNCYS